MRNGFENLKPLNGGTDQRITVSTTAVSLAAVDADSTHVLVSIEAQAVNATFDGSDPVGGSNGHTLAAGSLHYWSKAMASAAKFIRAGGTDAAVQATPLCW